MIIRVHGIEQAALRSEKTEDGVHLQYGSLYLQGVKIATFLQEKRGVTGAYSVQLFMMNGYSEEAFCKALAAYDLNPETLMDQFQWLKDMQTQYESHADTASGIAVLQHVQDNITMGIPMRLASAPEDIVLKELQHFIEKNEESHGACLGYALFRSEDDFSRGEIMNLSALKA